MKIEKREVRNTNIPLAGAIEETLPVKYSEFLKFQNLKS